MNESFDEIGVPTSMTTLGVMATLILGLQMATGAAIYFAFDDWADRGTFGDMFGAVNALFSGLAFAGVIYTILLQRHELALQRKELELTREELSRSADAQAAQAQLQMQQHVRVYAENILAAAQDARRFGTAGVVDQIINHRSTPKSQPVMVDFLSNFESFMRQHYAATASTLGLNSREVRGLIQLDNVLGHAQKNDEWSGVEAFQKEQTSVGDLLQRLNTRLMEQLENQLQGFDLLLAKSKSTSPERQHAGETATREH
jgi:hypothetical protein